MKYYSIVQYSTVLYLKYEKEATRKKAYETHNMKRRRQKYRRYDAEALLLQYYSANVSVIVLFFLSQQEDDHIAIARPVVV
jgi:hypothetical protein